MAQTITNLDEFRGKPLEGEWWEPDQPAKTFRGILYVEENNHGTLTIKAPSKVMSGLRVEPLEPRTIFGNIRSQYTYSITLFNAGIMSSATHYSNEDHETEVVFFTNKILIGGHVASEDDSIFNGALVSITGLEEWYDKSGFSGNVASHFPTENVNLLYQASASPCYDVGANKTLCFRSHYSGPIFFSGIKKFKMEEYNVIELYFKKSVSINELIREIIIWQNFLTFGLGQAAYPDGLRFFIGERENPSFNVGLLVPGWVSHSDLKRLSKSEILFPISKLGSRVGDYLRAWREKYDVIEIVILLFASQYYLKTSRHLNLFMHLQALEVLQRALFDGSRLGDFPDKGTKKSTLEALRASIPTSLADNLREKIYQQIGWIGSLTFLDRLTYLYNLYPKTIGQLFPTRDDDMKLLKDVRNFLAHYSNGKAFNKNFLWSRQLMVLSEKTKLFLEICLLGTIGMSDDEIIQFVDGFEPYRAWQYERHQKCIV